MSLPKGFEELEGVESVYMSDREIVITGTPDDNDDSHDCDALGCSSVNHVLIRVKV